MNRAGGSARWGPVERNGKQRKMPKINFGYKTCTECDESYWWPMDWHWRTDTKEYRPDSGMCDDCHCDPAYKRFRNQIDKQYDHPVLMTLEDDESNPGYLFPM